MVGDGVDLLSVGVSGGLEGGEETSAVGVGVIVEGVETESQLEFLISTGKSMCAQGWYFGRPFAAAALRALHKKANTPAEAEVV